MLNVRNRSPFTSTQWQELEHQALIFKYMVSGVPVPIDLLYSIKRSLDSSMASSVFPHQPSGWGCFQLGFSRKQDPEPGRCRRTDGKKWRCSKEAHPDSKYCERHMHRGKNRSRKPVEVPSSSTTSTHSLSISSTPSPSTSSYSFPSAETAESHVNTSQNSLLSNFLYSNSCLPRSASAFPLHDASSSHGLVYDPMAYAQADKEYSRYFNGGKEDADERSFQLAEGSGSGCARNLQESQQFVYRGYHQQQAQFPIYGTDAAKHQRAVPEQQHCFVLGTDIKSSSSTSTKTGTDSKETESDKQLHQFFGEWPLKNTDSWLDLASSSRKQTDG